MFNDRGLDAIRVRACENWLQGAAARQPPVVGKGWQPETGAACAKVAAKVKQQDAGRKREEEKKQWAAHCKALGHNEWHYAKSRKGVLVLKCYLCRERVGPHRNGTGPHRNGSQPPPEFDWHSQKLVPEEQMPKEWRKKRSREVPKGYDRVICLPVAEGCVFEEGYDTVICLPAAEGYVFNRPKASAGYTQSCTASDDAQSGCSRALRSSKPPAEGPPSPHTPAVSPLTHQPEVLQYDPYADPVTAEANGSSLTADIDLIDAWFRSLAYDRDYDHASGRYWSDDWTD